MAYEQLKPWIQRFVDAYVANAHAPDAAKAYRIARPTIKAANVAACKLMARPEVQAAIAERLVRRREVSELDEKWVLDRLRKIHERCMQEEPVLDREGNPTGEFRFDSTGAIRSAELIGKHFAMFTDRVEVKHIEQMPDEELDIEIERLQSRRAAAAAGTAH